MCTSRECHACVANVRMSQLSFIFAIYLQLRHTSYTPREPSIRKYVARTNSVWFQMKIRVFSLNVVSPTGGELSQPSEILLYTFIRASYDTVEPKTLRYTDA